MGRMLRWLLRAVPVLLGVWLVVAVTARPAPAPSCAEDYPLPLAASAADDMARLWSAQGGHLDFAESEGEPTLRFQFRPEADTIRFDRDAAVRVRVDFHCPGEAGPLALEAEIRFSQTLGHHAELQDVMFLGAESVYLAGAAVPRAGRWTPVRIPLPRETGRFTAVHFGMGVGWVRERPGADATFELRRARLLRRRPLYVESATHATETLTWRDPDHPLQNDPRSLLPLARGAPAWAILALPPGPSQPVEFSLPSGVRADLWQAEWLPIERKLGVVEERPLRLLPLVRGRLAADRQTRLVWIRLRDDGAAPGLHTLRAHWQGRAARVDVQVFPLSIPEGSTHFQIYYQMNENWPGYVRYGAFYANAPAHFRQLRDFGFTGVHLSEEPRVRLAAQGVAVDLTAHGRYWQRWPHPLAEVLRAAGEAGFADPLIWEGLRIFRRDDVWNGVRLASGLLPAVPPSAGIDSPPARLAALAASTAREWTRRTGRAPMLSVDDEPGVKSDAAVAETGRHLRALREAGYRTYLTTHARLHDSFHRLAPWLSVNVLHAEDVTAGAAQFAAAHGGELWLYNGGSMNIGPPVQDRFFYGLYGWRAGAAGLTQWIYARPSSLADPLEPATMLQDDAQFYALPGRDGMPAPTPGLVGLAAGIVDRRILDLAAARRAEHPPVDAVLRKLADRLPLAPAPDEFALYRLQRAADLHAARADLLRALAGQPVESGAAAGIQGTSTAR